MAKTKTKKRVKKYNPNKSIDLTLTGNHVVDMLFQSDIEGGLVTASDKAKLSNDFDLTMRRFQESKAVYADCCRLAENVYLTKVMIESIKNSKINYADKNADSYLYMILTLDSAYELIENFVDDLLIKMVERLYKNKGEYTFFLLGEVAIWNKFKKLHVEIAGFITAGMFTQCVKQTCNKLNNYQDIKLKHLDLYRVRRSLILMHKAKTQNEDSPITENEMNDLFIRPMNVPVTA